MSHSFQSEVPGSGKVIAWTSSALFAYFRDITCPSSLFTLPPEQRIIYEAILLHSPAPNRNISCRQHLPLLRVLCKGRCVLAASLLLCSPVLFPLCWQQMTAAFGGFGWREPDGDTHPPSPPAAACVSLWLCIPTAVLPSCGLRALGNVTFRRWGHLCAVALFSGTSLHNWALQYLQHLGVVVAVCSCPHIPKAYWISQVPTGFKHPGFSNPKKQKRASASFLSSIEHVPSTEMLWQGPWVEV